MRAWKEHQQRGKEIAICTACRQKIYANQPNTLVCVAPLQFQHRECPKKGTMQL